MKSRRVTALLLGLFLLLNALLSGGEIQYFLFFAYLLVLGGSYVFVKVNERYLYMYFSYLSTFMPTETGSDEFSIKDRKIIAGKDIKIQYNLSNFGLLPIINSEVTIHLSNKLGGSRRTEKILFHPHQVISIVKNLRVEHRGIYNLAKVEVDIKDPLGLFPIRKYFDFDVNLMAYPQIHDLQFFPITKTDFYGREAARIRFTEDYTNITSLRPYHPGDPIKKIHWKASTQRGEMIVKEFERQIGARVAIFVNGYEKDYSPRIGFKQDEKIVEIAGSLLRYFLRKKTYTSIQTWDHNGKMSIKGGDGAVLNTFLDRIITYEPTANLPFDRQLESELVKLEAHTPILLLTPSLSDDFYQHLLVIRKRGFRPVLLVNELTEQRKRALLVSGIHVVNFSLEDPIAALEVTYEKAW